MFLGFNISNKDDKFLFKDWIEWLVLVYRFCY